MNFWKQLLLKLKGGSRTHIRVRVNREDRSVDFVYIPKKNVLGNLIKDKKHGRSWSISKEDIFMTSDGYLEVIYNDGDHRPVNYLKEMPGKKYDPAMIAKAIDGSVVQALIREAGTDHNKLQKLVTFALIGVVGGTIATIYVLSNRLAELHELVTQQGELIENMAEIIARLRP